MSSRGEWFDDNDASRVFGSDYLTTSDFGNPSFFQAYSGDFYEVSLGLNWKPTANIVVRPELRWDWFVNSNVQTGRPFGEDPSNGGAANELNQFLVAFDAIVLW